MIDNTSKNIKALRNAYGETQLELAFAIGLDSPSAISQYENGTRTPQTCERQRLAEHFRITEDELAHGDYSDLDLKSFAVNDREIVLELFFKILPIIRTEKAMQDARFKKGYEAHMRTYEDAKAGKPVNECDAITSIEAYADAFYDNHVCEAAANMLWWIVIEGVGVNCGTASEDVNKQFRNSLNMAEFLKSWFLKSCDDESGEEHIKAREEFREDLAGIDTELLKALKECPHLSELADYYSAIMYILGIVNNGLTQEMNQTVGYEMLRAAARLGNKFAKRTLSAPLELKKD